MKTFYVASVICCLMACNYGRPSKEVKSNANTIGCTVPATTDKEWYTSGKKAPLFDGLQGVHFTISTSVKAAQTYFNQGMMLSYGFNHAEAARSFFEATRLDSTCAMAYWGFAYVLGPNYNAGMESDNFQRAYEAVVKAQALSHQNSPKEQALIAALASRYVKDPPADRSALDSAYAAAMKKVYTQFSDDPDIGALYAEAMMNLHPWDLYEKRTQAPKAWTPGIIAVLEHLMQLHPTHPGAHHFYIHALEASSQPEKAIHSAKLLDSLVPGAGHLLHMPSHIYIRTGDYHEGSLSNIRAVTTDSVYTVACHAQGAYPLAYYPHNYHFLAATATLEGHSALAWQTAVKLQQHTSEEIMSMPGWGTLQHYYTIPFYIAAKLSMWDTILALPAPDKHLVYPRAIWHYAKGMAYLGRHEVIKARKELDSLYVLAADTILKSLTIWNINTSADLVEIAGKVLAAGIAVQQQASGTAISLLKEAVAMEDHLNYNEPPDWFFSVRHHLGAVLLKAGQYRQAETVYREDLGIWRKNGWALIGLYNALVLQKKNKEAKEILAAFESAWQYADVKINSSSSITN
ncbi:tetratricopeptide (TPR) repeat protein [Chitinophaga sp. W3I9]|uniref:tetratricopeptide repeat protein n=1 Tax=unclassified Chitinophaga TaxID=2619133 RepID=UPI003D24DA6D